MSENKRPSQKSWLTIGLILILCVVNLLLIKQNLDLRKQLAAGGRTIDLTTNLSTAWGCCDICNGYGSGWASLPTGIQEGWATTPTTFLLAQLPYSTPQKLDG